MMQTLNPYSTTAKTAEIMARYRPIAPKPEASGCSTSPENSNALPHSISKSPFLRNIWPHLQARPTRTRKRGRSALGPPPLKRARACLQGLSPPYQVMASPAKSWSLQGFVHNPNGLPQIPIVPNLVPLKCGLDNPVSTLANSITDPFLSSNSPPKIIAKPPEPTSPHNGGIDLNITAEVPEEIDFMSKLQFPSNETCPVITPRPVRPIGSTIHIRCITKDDFQHGKKPTKKPEEVENEVEAEKLPAVVSDSNNKVRLANSAYKEMVGQPECRWLDYVAYGSSDDGKGACKRICGEVILQLLDSSDVPLSSDRFTCWVRIEWRSNDDKKKNSVNAFCDAVKLGCHSKDYLFQWRFHTKDHSPESASITKSSQV